MMYWLVGVLMCICFFFFKQKTAYEMRISDWSSDVCSSDLSFQAGLEAGRTENLEAGELIIAECRALMQSLDEARTIDKAALGPMMKKALLDLTAQIVEAHVAADPAFVNGCIGRALSTLKEAHEAARLYLHPDDIATVGEDTTDGY